jgi:aminopeptidase N
VRRVFCAGGFALALLVLLGSTDASARAKPSLVISSLASHHGARIGPLERFRISGVVRNRGRSASPALVSASLRRDGKMAFALGARNLRRVPAGTRRQFKINALGPLLPPGAASKRYTLSACVRPRRGARSSCSHLKRTVVVVAPGKGSGLGNGTGTGSGGNGTGTGGTTAPGGSATGTAPDGHPFTPGARTVGDRLFPAIGNGGYDATHYDLAIAYDPATKRLQGTATIDARATQDLSQFSLDLHALPVTSVLIDGAQATFSQQGDKLVVNPAKGIPAAAAFTTTVAYASPVIAAYTDPDGSSEGWVATSDGAFVANEPVGSMSWFPNDDVPTDKATYDLRITVPASREVLGNGRLVGGVPSPNADGTRTWHWVDSQPTSSYLVTATNGEFDFTPPDESQPTPGYYAVDSTYTAVQKPQMQSDLARTPDILSFYAGFLSTPYPYDAMGGVIDKGNVGYALETQTKPMYDVSNNVQPGPGLATISHEMAHQWFGDDVSPATWSDIWLNEGPAEFFSWLWQERGSGTPGPTTQQRFTTSYNNPAMNWSIPPAAPPTAADMFDSDAMYTRGAMVMEALREIAGEPVFKTILAKYLAQHQYGNASTQQFIDLWKSDSGKDPARLDAFFKQWLYGTAKPTITPSNF